MDSRYMLEYWQAIIAIIPYLSKSKWNDETIKIQLITTSLLSGHDYREMKEADVA